MMDPNFASSLEDHLNSTLEELQQSYNRDLDKYLVGSFQIIN